MLDNPFLDDDNLDETAEIAPKTRTVPWGKDHTEAELAEIAAIKAAGGTPPGHKKSNGSVYNRQVITDIDNYVVRFLLTFRYAKPRQIAQLLGVTYETANRRLCGLAEKTPTAGLTVSRKVAGRSTFFATAKAAKKLEEANKIDPDSFTLYNPNETPQYPDHTLAVNQFIVHAMSGSNQIVQKMRPPTFDELISEHRIQKIWAREISSDRSQPEGFTAERFRIKAAAALKNGTVAPSDLLAEFPTLWIPSVTTESKHGSSRRPDLIINNEARRTSLKPVSIAVEVEITKKTPSRYDRIFEIYKNDKITYAGVFWVCGNAEIKKLVKAAAERAGMLNKIMILDLVGSGGVPYAGPESL